MMNKNNSELSKIFSSVVSRNPMHVSSLTSLRAAFAFRDISPAKAISTHLSRSRTHHGIHTMRTTLILLLVVFGWVGGLTTTQAEVSRTQTISLRAGWNAVFLEVEPQVKPPEKLFAQSPVEVVAAFFPSRAPVYFPVNPADHPWQEENWNVWYAPARDDAFLSNLHAVPGNQAYLIYSKSDFVLNVVGRPVFKPIRWQPDSLNLVGFSLDPQSPPTFQKFFAGAKAHEGRRVFRLEGGRWALLRDPATTPMRAGEACWVECSGSSDYQGPISVKLPMSNAVEFGAQANDLAIEIVNRAPGAATISVELAAGVGNLPLSLVSKDLGTLQVSYPALDQAITISELPSGEAEILRLAPRREVMFARTQSAMLKVSNGAGVQLWIPVNASHPTAPH
jgi:hypothetical protein